MSTNIQDSQPTQTAPPPSAPARKPLSLKQAELALELCTAYGFDESQISFEGNKLDPIFDFEALSLLAVLLSDIQDIRVSVGDVNPSIGLVSASCAVTLADGRTREFFGSCMVEEVMHDNTTISSIQQALTVARARAQRVGLRAVGFDPVRAHREHKASAKPALGNEPDQRSNELAEIHLHAETLGLIKGEDKSLYYQNMASFFQDLEAAGTLSAGMMNDAQRAQWLGILRAWVQARKVAGTLSSPTSPAAK